MKKYHWIQWIRISGWWQLRLWLPNHTLRITCERKNVMPGEILGGWERAGE